MNKIIEKQLNSVRSVKLNFDKDTKKIFIPRTLEIIPEALNVGDIYLIELSDILLQPTSNSTLSSNWNNGRVPTHKYYKVELLDVMGNMYKFNGIAYENEQDLYFEDWYGWFPREYFKVVRKVI